MTDTPLRKLTTILCADVANYSQFMARDEEKGLRLLRAHREIFASIAQLHGGRIFNTGGDSILCEFASAVEAVRAATEIQYAVESRNAALPENDRMRFRIGINLGDVLVHGDDLLGDGVNVAARIQTAAPAGGVSVSGSVYDQITGKLDLTFQELGERDFKNLGRPVRTFTIVQAGEQALPRSQAAPIAKARIADLRRLWPWALGAAVVIALGVGQVVGQQRDAEKQLTRFDGVWRGRYACTMPDGGYPITWKVNRGIVTWRNGQPGQPGYQEASGSPIQPDGSLVVSFEGLFGGVLSPNVKGSYSGYYTGQFSEKEFRGVHPNLAPPRVCTVQLTRQ